MSQKYTIFLSHLESQEYDKNINSLIKKEVLALYNCLLFTTLDAFGIGCVVFKLY